MHAAAPNVVDFFARDEEHRNEVASVFIDDDDVRALLHLEINIALRWNILLKLALFITLGHDLALLIVLPHLSDFESLFIYFLGELLDYVKVVH